MPTFAFQRPVSGRVETVYGISISSVYTSTGSAVLRRTRSLGSTGSFCIVKSRSRPGSPRDWRVPLKTSQTPNRVITRNGPPLPAVIPAPVHPSHSLQKHRQKNHVHADERRPKMHFAPEIVHLSAGRFREPIINPREEREDRARRDDVMKMRDHVVSVVQVKIG